VGGLSWAGGAGGGWVVMRWSLGWLSARCTRGGRSLQRWRCGVFLVCGAFGCGEGVKEGWVGRSVRTEIGAHRGRNQGELEKVGREEEGRVVEEEVVVEEEGFVCYQELHALCPHS